ncbi:MAG: hypothetical protein ABIO44_03840 [Saprospiraceae bacterium]
MLQLFIATLLVSLLHALIPSHWIPLLSVSKTYKWTKKETLIMSFYLSCAHVLSSLVIGILLGVLGLKLNETLGSALHWISPLILISFGVYFLWRHHTHHHFHVDDELIQPPIRKRQLFLSLMMFMILSPCLEITGFFFGAGSFGYSAIFIVAIIYTLCSIIAMVLWVNFLYVGFQNIDAHRWEHRSGIWTGVTIIVTGILSFFIH